MLSSVEWQQLRIRRSTAERLKTFAANVEKAYGRRAAGKLFIRSELSLDEAVSLLLDRVDNQRRRCKRYDARKRKAAELAIYRPVE